MRRKFTMKFLCGVLISIGGFLCCVKKPKVMVNPICLYMRLPFLSDVVPRNTFVARFIGFWRGQIFHVLGPRSFAQIFPSIVRRVMIYVVNFIFWPLSGHYSPRNTVNFIMPVINSYNNSPVTVLAASNFANYRFLTNSCFPPKFPGVRVIIEKLNKFFWRQHNSKIEGFLALSTGGAIGKL